MKIMNKKFRYNDINKKSIARDEQDIQKIYKYKEQDIQIK